MTITPPKRASEFITSLGTVDPQTLSLIHWTHHKTGATVQGKYNAPAFQLRQFRSELTAIKDTPNLGHLLADTSKQLRLPLKYDSETNEWSCKSWPEYFNPKDFRKLALRVVRETAKRIAKEKEATHV